MQTFLHRLETLASLASPIAANFPVLPACSTHGPDKSVRQITRLTLTRDEVGRWVVLQNRLDLSVCLSGSMDLVFVPVTLKNALQTAPEL